MTDKSESHLLKLLADTSQPSIARATAAHYLGGIQTTASANALINAIQDKESMVRYYSLRSLESFPPDLWIQAAQIALSDKVRAVRIAAADLYHIIPAELIPAAARNAFQQADAENRKYLNYQRDFSVGNVMVADYELQGGNYSNAIVHYVRGLKKDSLMNYARINLSAAYSNAQNNPQSLKTLNEAAEIDPSNDQVLYNLGLLHYEMRDLASSFGNFEKAIKLNSQNPGLYYNYGLMLQQQNRNKEAENILLKGYSISPQAINLNYALTYFYVSQNNPHKARPYAQMLKANDPNNPDYQQLFRSIGL